MSRSSSTLTGSEQHRHSPPAPNLAMKMVHSKRLLSQCLGPTGWVLIDGVGLGRASGRQCLKGRPVTGLIAQPSSRLSTGIRAGRPGACRQAAGHGRLYGAIRYGTVTQRGYSTNRAHLKSLGGYDCVRHTPTECGRGGWPDRRTRRPCVRAPRSCC